MTQFRFAFAIFLFNKYVQSKILFLKNTLNMEFLPLTESQLRQYIDAESVFKAWRTAKQEAKTVRGSMFWRELRGKATLIRVSTSGAQTVIGKDTPENREIYTRFMQRKESVTQRVKTLSLVLEEQKRLNRALRVGRTPDVVIRILNAIDINGFSDYVLTIGTHALFAFESAAGVRIQPQALATRDVDIFFDVRKRLSFFERLNKSSQSFMDVLRKADPTFIVMDDQKQTAVNDAGFEVDILRRVVRDDDPHPLRMSGYEDDIWAVQVPNATLVDATARFSQMVISPLGEMALMHTMHPLNFVRLKKTIASSPQRDPLKKPKDALQAEIVQKLIDDYLPQFRNQG